MAQVVPIVLYRAEGYAAESVDLQDVLLVRWGRGTWWGADVNVALFAGADAGARAVECVPLLMRVQGEVVQAAVSEAVSVVCCVQETLLSVYAGGEWRGLEGLAD